MNSRSRNPIIYLISQIMYGVFSWANNSYSHYQYVLLGFTPTHKEWSPFFSVSFIPKHPPISFYFSSGNFDPVLYSLGICSIVSFISEISFVKAYNLVTSSLTKLDCNVVRRYPTIFWQYVQSVFSHRLSNIDWLLIRRNLNLIVFSWICICGLQPKSCGW